MNLKLLVPRNVFFGVCPNCKEEMTLERAKTESKFEKIILTILKKKKYHCKSCKWYGSLFRYTLAKNFKKILLNYLIIISIVVIGIIFANLILKKIFNP